MSKIRIDEIIQKFDLAPHPEGGYYKEIYRSKSRLISPIVSQERNAVTQIYFLLSKGQVSRFHKVLHDEIWHFYEGSPLRLLQFDGESIQEEILGEKQQNYVNVVPGNVYQAAESTGDYSLVGCTVAPGFDFEDFSFLSDCLEDVKIFKEKYMQYQAFL